MVARSPVRSQPCVVSGFTGLLFVVPVAKEVAEASHPQLACLADQRRSTSLVGHLNLGVIGWIADGAAAVFQIV